MVKGMAHITGGGLVGNIPRVLPKGLAAQLGVTSWKVPPIFDLVRKVGDVPLEEMYPVFNMGIGMVVITSPDSADSLVGGISEAAVVGEIVSQKDDRRVLL